MGFVSKDIFKSFWQDLVDEYITSIDPCLFYYEALVKKWTDNITKNKIALSSFSFVTFLLSANQTLKAI